MPSLPNNAYVVPDPIGVKPWLSGDYSLANLGDGNDKPTPENPTNAITVITPPADLHIAKVQPFSVVFRVAQPDTYDAVCLPADSLISQTESDGVWTCTYDPQQGTDGWQTVRVQAHGSSLFTSFVEWQVYYDNAPPSLDQVKFKKTMPYSEVELSSAGNIMVTGRVSDGLPDGIYPESTTKVWIVLNDMTKQVNFEADGFFWAVLTTVPGWNKMVVHAEDAALNTVSYTLPDLFVDKTNPQLQISGSNELNSYTFWGKDTVTLWVKVIDTSPWPITLTMTLSGAAPVKKTVMGTGEVAEFVVKGFSESIGVTFDATDVLGNTTSDSKTIIFDAAAPNIEIELPLINNQWYNKSSLAITGVASDFVSGIAAVDAVVTGPGGESATTSLIDVAAKPQSVVTLYGAVGLKGGDGKYTVAVTATDVVGNKFTVTKTFVRDTTPPSLTQQSTYFVPEFAYKTTEFAKGQLSTKPNSGLVTIFSEDVCKKHCGTIHKHPNRLDYKASQDIAKNNLPSFKVVASAQPGSPLSSVQYRFVFGDTKSSWTTLPWDGVVPVSVQTLWGPSTVLDGSEEMPTGFEVTATDDAGNVAVVFYGFDLVLTTPPLPYEVVAPSPAYNNSLTVSTLSFGAKNVHKPFDGGDDDMLTVARLKFQNPYAMPVTISFADSGVMPKTKVKLKGNAYYLDGKTYTPVTGSGCCGFCKTNTCSYQPALSTSPTMCQLPIEVDKPLEADFDFELDYVVWHILVGEKYKTSVVADAVVLQPGEFGLADLGAWTGWSYCAFPKPVNLAIQTKGGVPGSTLSDMYHWSESSSCETSWQPGKTLLAESAWCTAMNAPLASDPCWKMAPNYCGPPNKYTRYIHAELLKEVRFTTSYPSNKPLFSAWAQTTMDEPANMVQQLPLGDTVLTNVSIPGKTSPF